MNRAASPGGLAALRHFVRKRPVEERCDLCSVVVPEQHEHLVEPATRHVLCACAPCAILFSGASETRYRRVPRDITSLPEFHMDDELWNSLAIPAGLAFLFRSSARETMIALYPSPAGPTESALDLDSWEDIALENPRIREIRPDVEALLINRMNGAREYYLAPIDQCYRLAGLIRRHWRGFSGGDEAQQQIRDFFDGLKHRARSSTAGMYA
jgi:hypothetical protein